MNIRRLAIIAVILPFFASCKELDKLTQFEMDYETSVTIPGTLGINAPVDLITPEIETDSESKFSVNNTRKDLVEEIVLREMTLTIVSPQNEDFSFLNSIRIFINAEGLDEKQIAWKDPVAESASNVIALETSQEDLKEYLVKDQFSLRVRTKTDEIIAEDHEIKIQSVFFIDAKILGQ